MKGFSTKLFIAALLQYVAVAAVAQQSSEWINPKQIYFRIPVYETGIYKITGKELLEAGIPIDSIPATAFQIFRRGRELAIEIQNDSASKLTNDSYLTFYGRHNDGSQDSTLYIRAGAIPHNYYSLYSDTAAYFLSWRTDGHPGKRMQSPEVIPGSDTISYHIQQSLQLFTSFYAPGNFYPPGSSFETGVVLSTYDVGEGWTGVEIKTNDWGSFSFQTENAVRESFHSAYAEITLVGRSVGNHEIEIRTGTKQNPGKVLNKTAFSNYGSITIKTNLSPEDLGADEKITISVMPVKNPGSISVSAIRWHYPQLTQFPHKALQKTVHFDPLHAGKTWKVNGGLDWLLYDCSDEYDLKIVRTKNAAIPISNASKIISVKQFLTISGIKKSHFPIIDSGRTDYLIITHPLLRLPATKTPDPVEAYASYRSSESGGSFRPLILNIQQVYDRFNYGDPGPSGIRDMIRWFNKNTNLRFVFIIGKSIDPQTARKMHNPSVRDMIPNAGWPGSDLALAMETGSEPASYIPSVPIGRLNADSPEQVWTYLQKVKSMEAEPLSAPWRKNILHLSGGRTTSELTLFRDYVNSFEDKIKNTSLATSVSTISKKTDDPVEQFPLDIPINNGVALLTLFGHSGLNVTDLDIGYATDAQRNYNNAPRYPVVIVNGCATGSIFYSPSTISSDWILAPESGAVLFLAHTFNGISTSLKRYTDSFYNVLADSSFTSAPFGEIQKEAIRRNMQKNPGIADFTTAQQMNLHGDPAIRIFPARLPDYRFDSTLVQFSDISGAALSSKSDSIRIRLGVANSGRFQKGGYKLLLTHLMDSLAVKYQFELPAISIADTIFISVPNRFKKAGTQHWTFSVDADNLIREENELNNLFTLQTILPEGGAIPLLPLHGFTTSNRLVELVAQLPDGRPNETVIFEWGSSRTLSGSSTASITASGIIARHQITITENAQGVYWRVYLPEDLDHPSQIRHINFDESVEPAMQLPEVVIVSVNGPIQPIQEGDSLRCQVNFRNITNTSFKDSITIKIVANGLRETVESVVKISAISGNETRKFVFSLPTLGKTGIADVFLHFNWMKLPEQLYQNNISSLTYLVIPDVVPPVLTVSLDGRLIQDNEVVSANPLIGVQVNDENPFLVRSDTSGIYIGIGEECSGCSERRIELKTSSITKTRPNHFLLQVRPDKFLKPGTYYLYVKARDTSKNMAAPYQIRFRVSDNQIITEAGVSPNPSTNYFRFYIDLEGAKPTGLWTIKLTDVLGRKIKTLKIPPNLGWNEIFWQPENLPAGLILYEMKMDYNGWQLSPSAQKGMSGKLLWAP